MEIIIVRHGRPKPVPNNWISASHFIDWVASYNKSGLCETSHPSKKALAYAQACKVIVSSNIPRSIDSARALDHEKIIFSDKQLIETELPSPNWNLLKLPPKTWATILRILWILGYSKNSESLGEAKQRASQAAEKLIQLAREHQKVLFVGHGVFNRLLANELRNRGWSGPQNPGLSHWSLGAYKQ